MQDVSFHQCVNLGRYNTEKVVSFVPPDGEFELMKYRCNDNISLPFRVIPVINELGRTRLEVKVAVKSAFNDKLFALNVVITIPMPDNTAKADIQPSQGIFQTCAYLQILILQNQIVLIMTILAILRHFLIVINNVLRENTTVVPKQRFK